MMQEVSESIQVLRSQQPEEGLPIVIRVYSSSLRSSVMPQSLVMRMYAAPLPASLLTVLQLNSELNATQVFRHIREF